MRMLLRVGVFALVLHAAEAMSVAWGGSFAAEAAAAVEAVQNAMKLCNGLACEMEMAEADLTGGKTMDACDTTAGVSFIKPGDSTPVTAGDFAIQGLVSAALQAKFPEDRFMGEEDAGDLRDDEALRGLALRLCTEFGGPSDETAFIDAVDRGLEPNRGKSERVWVLDPIDGTKGFMTGQGYVVGLALLDGNGDAVVGVMGVPAEDEAPPIMAAVKGCGLKWFNAEGGLPVPYDPPAPEWSTSDDPKPPWLVSPQKSFPECAPFGEEHAPDVICCGGACPSALRSGVACAQSCLHTTRSSHQLTSIPAPPSVLLAVNAGALLVPALHVSQRPPYASSEAHEGSRDQLRARATLRLGGLARSTTPGASHGSHQPFPSHGRGDRSMALGVECVATIKSCSVLCAVALLPPPRLPLDSTFTADEHTSDGQHLSCAHDSLPQR